MLRGDQFNEALVTFLVDYLENNNSARILGSKKLIDSNGDTCYSFISQEDRMVKSEEVTYYAKHKEADTRMIYHIVHLPSGTIVVMRTVDTNVVVIALGCLHQLQDKRIWVESGIQSKNNLRRYISINQLFHQLGEPLCKALPFYHTFTGCDYTSLFNRKGKIKPFKLLEKNPELQEAFLNLLHSEGISDDIKSIITSFVCQMYGRKKANSVDQASLEIFVTKHRPKKRSASLNQFQTKKLDSSIMPLCFKVLHQKVKQCIYVASIWLNTLRMEPTPHLPTSFGWTLDEDGTYCIKWCEGDVAPKIV